MKRNTKFALGGLILLAGVAVISSVSIALVLSDKMKATGDILTRLRSLMNGSASMEPLHAYIIPTDDAHQVRNDQGESVTRQLTKKCFCFQSEYIAPRDRRRQFVTGFDGSAGTAVVTQSEALLWTDGRYYLQASQQLDNNWTLMKDGLPDVLTMTQWFQKNCKPGQRIGVDPSLMSTRQWNTLVAAFDNTGCVMTAVKENLVDKVWDEQPAQPNNKVISLDVKFAGKLVGQKLVEIREKMKEQSAKVLVVTALDEIACEL
jgi:Xaa-Pro aminopeptidase